MNQFEMLQDGQVLMTLADVPAAADVAPDIVLTWIRKGLQVRYVDITPRNAVPAPERALAVVDARATRVADKPHQSTPRLTDRPEWQVGQKVYIRWGSLTADHQIETQDLRYKPAKVVEIRGGQGVRKTVGIKWEDDKDTSWYAPLNLTNVLVMN